jgi:hypothetical protein
MDREEAADQIRYRQQQRWDRAIFVSILAIIGTGVVGITAQDYVFQPRRGGSPRTACVANLRCLDGVKSTWALENKKSTNDVPTDSDLFGPTLYIREKPTCPSGGSYNLRAVGRKPRCSVPGHTL